MKSYKPHLLKKVMGDLRKVPLGGHEMPSAKPSHPGAAQVQITIAHGGKPMDEDPAEEAMESPDLESAEESSESPFGNLKSKHKFGK